MSLEYEYEVLLSSASRSSMKFIGRLKLIIHYPAQDTEVDKTWVSLFEQRSMVISITSNNIILSIFFVLATFSGNDARNACYYLLTSHLF
jgi:hypothetical protein